jgi:hypothetical protein
MLCGILPTVEVRITYMKISKGQAVDGKPETEGKDYEDWLCARL